MKAGIITLYDENNYGNLLQNFALQYFLKKNEVYSETVIRNRFSRDSAPDVLSQQKFAKFKDKSNKEKLRSIKNNLLSRIRISKMRQFCEKYIHYSNYFIDDFSVPKGLTDEYDLFFVGSDQVWNPEFGGSRIEYLQFVEPKKRFAFAASFGKSNIKITKEEKELFMSFNQISVREETGADIIFSCTGKRPEVVIDPTLCLNVADWSDGLGSLQNICKYKYIATYFLDKPENDVVLTIRKIAKERQLKVINLGNISYPRYYSLDPKEFIEIIKYAEALFTDSFHGSIFSILFNTPFTVCKRGDLNTRVDTLLLKLQLSGRKWESVKQEESYFDLSFQKTYELLETERLKATTYLHKCLSCLRGDSECSN